jgi:hypothetical protein
MLKTLLALLTLTITIGAAVVRSRMFYGSSRQRHTRETTSGNTTTVYDAGTGRWLVS